MKLNDEQIRRFREIPFYNKYDMDKIEPMSKKILANKPASDFRKTITEGSVRYSESSGTSGRKSFGWYNENDFNRMASYLTEAGVELKKEDMVLIRFPYALCFPAFLIEHACKLVEADIIPASGRTEITPYFKVVDILQELNVSVLACNPREAELLYEAAAVQGLTVDSFPSLRAILLAGEVVSPARKKYLERIWGVPVFNFYGLTELGNYGYTCKFGNLHFDETNYIAEFCRDEKDFVPFNFNSAASAYISSLNNEAAPHMRFETGDILGFSESDCKCGSCDRIIIGYGRKSDVCIIAKKEFTFYEVQEIIYSLSTVPFGWKLYIDDIATLKLEYNRRDCVDIPAIKESIYKCFGCDDFSIKIECYQEFELFDRSSIYHYTVSKKPQYIYNHFENRISLMIEEGKAFLNEGDYKSAEKKFREILKDYPELPEGHLWTAATLGLKADEATFIEKMAIFPKLYASTNKAVELDKYSPFGNYLMGILMMKTPVEVGGDKTKAYRYLCISKYLGYCSADLERYIKNLEEILFADE